MKINTVMKKLDGGTSSTESEIIDGEMKLESTETPGSGGELKIHIDKNEDEFYIETPSNQFADLLIFGDKENSVPKMIIRQSIEYDVSTGYWLKVSLYNVDSEDYFDDDLGSWGINVLYESGKSINYISFMAPQGFGQYDLMLATFKPMFADGFSVEL